MIPRECEASSRFRQELQPRSLLARAMLCRRCMGRWGCVRVITEGKASETL